MCSFKTISRLSTFKGIKIVADSVATCENELKEKIASSAGFRETLLTKQGCTKDQSQSAEVEEKWIDAITGILCGLEIETSCQVQAGRQKRSPRSANLEYDGQLNVTSKKSSAVVSQSSNSEDNSGDNSGDKTEDNTGGKDNHAVTEDQQETLEDFTVTDLVEALNAAKTDDERNNGSEEETSTFFEFVVDECHIEVENEDTKETNEEIDTENVKTIEVNIPDEEETEDKENDEEVNVSREQIDELEKLIEEQNTKNEDLAPQIELLDENYLKLEDQMEDISSRQKKSQLLAMMQQSRSSVEIFNLKKQIEEMASQFYNGMAQTLNLFTPKKSP